MKPVEEMNREEALDAGLVGTVITGMVDPKVPSFWPHDEVHFHIGHIMFNCLLTDQFICLAAVSPHDSHFLQFILLFSDLGGVQGQAGCC